MGVRSRVVSSALVGGLMTGALVLGAPAASALPSVTGACDGSVSAKPGDPIYGPGGVQLGTAGKSSGPVTGQISGLLGLVSCTVNVTVEQVESVAPAAKPVGGAVKGATGALTGGGSQASPGAATRSASTTPSTRATAAPGSRAPAVGAASAPPAGTSALADAPLSPAFAPMFAGLPSSFLASAAPGASAVSAAGTYDPSLLLGGAPAVRVGLPSLLGDPTTAVTSASQLQALPIDGLGGGFGVPAVLVVLAAAGAAAFGVRRTILGRRVLPGRSDLPRLLHRSARGGTAGS